MPPKTGLALVMMLVYVVHMLVYYPLRKSECQFDVDLIFLHGLSLLTLNSRWICTKMDACCEVSASELRSHTRERIGRSLHPEDMVKIQIKIVKLRLQLFVPHVGAHIAGSEGAVI
jgi:hypothetical protein